MFSNHHEAVAGDFQTGEKKIIPWPREFQAHGLAFVTWNENLWRLSGRVTASHFYPCLPLDSKFRSVEKTVMSSSG